MPVQWTPSADKHGIPHEDAIFAIAHAVGSEQLQGRPGEVTTVFVGHPHAQTDRYIEVIVALRQPSTMVVFHAMPLSDVYRHLI